MPKLTKSVVEGTKPGERDIVLRDTLIKGFLCKVTPKGKRVYMLYYRTKEGRERKPVIGEHGAITCEDARDIATEWLREVKKNQGDPSLYKQQARKAPTLADFARQYDERHISTMKPGSQKEERRMWEKYILPAIGKNKLASLTRQDIARLHHSLKDAPYMANRVLEALRRALNRAAEWGYIEGENPCRHIKKFKEHSRERFLSSAELAYVGEALRHAEAENTEMQSVTLALRLLIFTGCRRNEILELQWNWIDFELGKIDFPDSKTGKKVVYLNPPSLELLQNAERVKGNPYVCPGRDGKSHLVNLQKPWTRIRRRAEIFRLIDLIAKQEGWSQEKSDKARQDSAADIMRTLRRYRKRCGELQITLAGDGIEDVRLHDLRHSFASVGAAGGLSLLMIGKLLGHREQSTTQRYAHLLGDPLKEASHLIGSRIAAALDGKQAEVLSLKKR